MDPFGGGEFEFATGFLDLGGSLPLSGSVGGWGGGRIQLSNLSPPRVFILTHCRRICLCAVGAPCQTTLMCRPFD